MIIREEMDTEILVCQFSDLSEMYTIEYTYSIYIYTNKAKILDRPNIFAMYT